MPEAAATPAPPLEPPEVMSALHGFRVRPCSGFSVNQRKEKAGTFVRPTITAPARRMLATTALSAGAMRSTKAGTPFVVASPTTSTLSLIVTGTPCRHPISRGARARSASCRRAASKTRSRSEWTAALSRGLTASMREKKACVTSTQEMDPARIRAAMSAASHCHTSLGSEPSVAARRAGLCVSVMRAAPQSSLMLLPVTTCP